MKSHKQPIGITGKYNITQKEDTKNLNQMENLTQIL